MSLPSAKPRANMGMNGLPIILCALDSHVLRDHRSERSPDILQEPGVFFEEGPPNLRGEVDVPFLLDEAQHLRAVEDVEEFLELVVVKFAEALVDREVLPQFLADRFRPRLVVSMEEPPRDVVRLKRLDRRLRRQARTRERGEDAASGDGFRLTRRVSYDEHIVRVCPAREAEGDPAGDVQDRL